MHERIPRLLDLVRDRIRLKHYSIRTEQTYVEWVRRFVQFCRGRHPRDVGAVEVEAFLTHLAVEGRVAASTQNQAKSALLFLYKEVLGAELPWLDGIQSAKRPARLPVVLTHEEVQAILVRADGTSGLILRLLYGTGMRILECLRLRVKDVDFARREILVRDGKGAKDRVTVLPARLALPLREHLARVRALHQDDLAAGFGAVYLPHALARKYPNAAREWAWQYVFPSHQRSRDSAPARSVGTTPARRRFKERCSKPCVRRASRRLRHRIRCATRLRRICSNRVTTFAPCKSSSVIATCPPR